jgi:nucleoside-diphosphate-sugar epimerase
MRVVVTGATGNTGTSLLRSLADEPAVDSVLGIARRLPELELPKVEWATADVVHDELVPLFRGADCVVHLAWLIQPSRDRNALWLTNVHGSSRVFRAVADAGVPALVHASSVGAYSPGPKDRPVDESWPVQGIRTSYYSRHKAEVERRLDRFELEHPEVRSARLRPGLIFKRESATGQRRLFAGPFLPSPLVRPAFVPFVPDTPGLRFQAVHSDDAGEAYRLAAVGEARGAFNVAADPVVGPDELAELLHAWKLPVPRQLLRAAAQLTWRLHLQPSDVGWVDMGLNVPIMDGSRARGELGWRPRHTSLDALRDVLGGIRDRAGLQTPPLEPRSRVEEIATGVGSREIGRGGK